MPAPFRPGSDPALGERILDATLVVVARWGLSKLTLGDVAKEARCGRASIYRVFPGGKDHLLAELGERELRRFVREVAAEVDGTATLEDALVVALRSSMRWIDEHAALQQLIAHEPDALLPFLGFGAIDRLYRATGILAGPHLVRFVGPEQAVWAAEWVGRLVLSLLFNPPFGAAADDPDRVRLLVRRFLVPALHPAAHPDDDTVPSTTSPSALQGS